MKKTIAGLTTFILLNTFFWQPHTIANTNKLSLQDKSKKPSKTKYLTVPYNESIRITTDFLGHDLKAIIDVLTKRKEFFKKGEFETTQEFNERINREQIKPILGTVTLDSKLAFVAQKYFLLDVKTSYDADSNLFSIEIPSSYEAYEEGYSLDSQIVDLGKYKASNAYGATVEVKEINYTTWVLFPGRVIEKQNIQLTMNRDAAINLKDNMGVMFICKIIKSDPIDKQSRLSEPTFQDPREILFLKYRLRVEIMEIKIFNKSTGSVYHTIKL
ncbi:MAG: hypothetical protein ACK6A9_11905 [Dolichospermum sp.]|jgi:hypothetical protein